MSTPAPDPAPDRAPGAADPVPGRSSGAAERAVGDVRGLSRTALPGPRVSAAPLPKIGMAVFAVGVLAVLADVVLFASGARDLPLWLNLVAMLAPIGLGIGLVGVFLENKHASPALRRRARPGA